MKVNFLSIVSMIVSTIFISSISSAPASASIKKNDRLRLTVLKHHPCNGKSTIGERIRFPNLAHAPLQKDTSRGEGCYSINGPVQVKKSITGTVQIYSEIRFGTQNAPIEPCRQADNRGCGGFGSCVYCDACSSAKKIDKTSFGLDWTGGKPLDCQKGLQAGNYSDINIKFCLPTKDDLLNSNVIDTSMLDGYASGGHIFSVTVYLFNENVNNLSANQLQKMAAAGSSDNQKMIGCHKIVGSIEEAE